MTKSNRRDNESDNESVVELTLEHSVTTNTNNEDNLEKDNEQYSRRFNNNCFNSKIIQSKFVQYAKQSFTMISGLYYVLLHTAFMVLIGFIILFVKNKHYLCMLLLVLTVDAFANIVFLDCPLTSLEKKYLNNSMMDNRLNTMKNLDIMYTNDKVYDTQLEVIINAWSICAIKILILIVFDHFNINY